jgi:hypothetical protein
MFMENDMKISKFENYAKLGTQILFEGYFL